MRIAICDDERIHLNIIYDTLKEIIDFKEMDIALFSSGSELLIEHTKKPFDIILLDIEMQEMHGFTVAMKLNAYQEECYIVFITSHDSFVFTATCHHPFGFVRKSFLKKELERVMLDLFNRYERREYIYEFLVNAKTFPIRISNIIYFMCKKNYISVVLKDERLLVRETFDSIEQRFKAYDFVRIHRNIIVNILYVSKIYKDMIVLDNGQEFKISRRRQNEVKKVFFNYIKKQLF